MDFIINFLGANPYQAIAVPVIGGLASGYFGNPRESMRGWYATLRKPPYNPPNWIFPPTWTALYISMGYASHLVAHVAMETLNQPTYLLARGALGLYTAQLVVNLLWTPLFFRGKNTAAALVNIGVLGGLLTGMTGLFFEVSEEAGWFVMPYLGWVGFATYLNYGIVKLNPGDGVAKDK